MTKCGVCKQQAAEWAWQPFGPGGKRDTFALPGSHYRGFPVVKVCEACRERIVAGVAVAFTCRGQAFRLDEAGVFLVEPREGWQ